MTPDFDGLARASTLIHMLQGAALLLLGYVEGRAMLLKNSGKGFGVAAAAVLALSGAAMFAALLGLAGGWSFGQLAQALAFRSGLYLFIAFACLYAAAGLSLLASIVLDRPRGAWRTMFLLLLGFAGVVYFLMPWRVNEEVWREAALWHYLIGATLLLAVAARAADIFLERRYLRLAWAGLLLAAGLQLVSYRESERAFYPRLVTLRISSGMPLPAGAANNAKPADKERTAD